MSAVRVDPRQPCHRCGRVAHVEEVKCARCGGRLHTQRQLSLERIDATPNLAWLGAAIAGLLLVAVLIATPSRAGMASEAGWTRAQLASWTPRLESHEVMGRTTGVTVVSRTTAGLVLIDLDTAQQRRIDLPWAVDAIPPATGTGLLYVDEHLITVGDGRVWAIEVASGTSTDLGPGLSVGAVVGMADGAALAGFRLEARSGRNHGSAELLDLVWNLDGQDAIAPGLLSGDRDRTVVSDTYYFDRAAGSATLTGSVRFTWDDPANTNGDRFTVSVFALSGLPSDPGGPIIPAPGALAVAPLALLARRRRGKAPANRA